jgi:uncharacterized glyoxalase superfamily protein PhnB
MKADTTDIRSSVREVFPYFCVRGAAADAGAVILREPADQSHGERQCRLRDPFGHEWLLGHPI